MSSQVFLIPDIYYGFMNKMRFYLKELYLSVALVVIFGTAPAQDALQVNGTTGSPLGGFGAGAVKFNANTGTFAAMTQPPADAYDFKSFGKAGLQLFVKREGKKKFVERMKAPVRGKGIDDDAIWPLHLVELGEVGGIKVSLKGFSPIDNVSYDDMSLPYAFYEVTLSNLENSRVETSFAFQWDSGNEAFTYIPNRGIANSSWAILAEKDSKQLLTAGNASDQKFAVDGFCDNNVDSGIAKLAVGIKLAAKETRKLRFVLAWYDHTDPEIAYYKNFYQQPLPIAQHGLEHFTKLLSNAEGLVNRLRASNLPNWLKNQTQNTLINLSTNSMYKKDGRVAFAEGQWTCFGTMDQMWHARQIIGQLVPFYAWQELRYWARTQMKNGQIHHDFNKMDVGPIREQRSVLVDWDDTEHADYRNILKWVDLNCAMIVSTYEMYKITGNRREFDFLWPYLKKAAQRILDQVDQYGNKTYPYTFDHSENSYDAGGDPNVFNASFSAVAYKVMVILAKEKGEDPLSKRYQTAYDAVVKSFADRYLNDANFKLTKHAESYFGGQWLALHLRLGEIWEAKYTDFVIDKLNKYYQPYYNGLGYPKGTYDEWTPYILVHHGGLFLNTRRANQWAVMQKDAYDRQYLNREFIFDHPLNILPKVAQEKTIATNYRSGNQYISMPGLWRNYYDIIGYHRDMRTNELWLKPVLPPELDHRLTDGMYVSPEGYGSISCTESGEFFQNKDILIRPEREISVSKLYLADHFGPNVKVTIDGKQVAFKRTGTGYAKELAIEYNGKINRKGLHIIAQGDVGDPDPTLPVKEKPAIVAIGSTDSLRSVYTIIEAESANKIAGTEIAQAPMVGKYVTSCNNFDYIQFSNIDFGKNAELHFFANVSSVVGSTIEVVLDNVAGEPVATCTVPVTGVGKWQVVTCPVLKVSGIHDVILRFSGSSADNLVDLDKITFHKKSESSKVPFK